MLAQRGAGYFNPDEAAARVLAANPGVSQGAANSAAWFEGKRLLERAIAEHMDYAFETTLGGNTITSLLEEALAAGLEVRLWYVGLSSPEPNIARVRARAASGGHDIPEATIRERYDRSRLNLIRLLPRLTELLVYDNSKEADPARGVAPRPMLILHMGQDRAPKTCELSAAPEWAKPILMAALRLKQR